MDYTVAMPLMLQFVDRVNRRLIGPMWQSSCPAGPEDLVIHCGQILERTRPSWSPSAGVSGEPVPKVKTESFYWLWRDSLALYLQRNDASIEQLADLISAELLLDAEEARPAREIGSMVVALLDAAFNRAPIIPSLTSLSRTFQESPKSVAYGLFVNGTLAVFRQDMIRSRALSVLPYRASYPDLGWHDVHFAWVAAGRLDIMSDDFFPQLYSYLERAWGSISTESAASNAAKLHS